MVRRGLFGLALIAAGGLSAAASAGEADVIAAYAQETAPGVWRVVATVRHGDEGVEHYADRFEVLSPEGEILGTRVLVHPHVGDQPFKRSLYDIAIPPTIKVVRVRAHDSVHEYGGETQTIILRPRFPAPRTK